MDNESFIKLIVYNDTQLYIEYNIGIPKGIPIFVLLLGDKSIDYTKVKGVFT